MIGNKQFQVDIDGKTVTLTTGGFAEQAGGAVTVQQGDTLLLAAATMSKAPREGLSFFPLTVDYEERMYAGGRIPGSFFRREGRPSEAAILIDRLTDRTIRPLFPKDMRNEVQVILYSLSADDETPIDVLAVLGASAALTISDVPFEGPAASIRVGRDENGAFIYNPSYQETEASDLNLRIAGSRDAILMVECNGDELDESVIISALQAGHQAMQPLIDLQEQIQNELGKDKRAYPSFSLDPQVKEAVEGWLGDRYQTALANPLEKDAFHSSVDEIDDEALEELANDDDMPESDIKDALGQLLKSTARRMIIDDGVRTDGRGTKDVREIEVRVDLSPRAHGSGLFRRGGTQVLTLATLGTPRERQEMDNLSPIDVKRYMHHYNFPPFSTGETKFMRGASRREIGHGALAERAILPVMPDQDEFPYTMRLVSEILSSNGSTSMASVCGSTLALLDTGVPIRAPVAGIAMGLIKEDGKYAILTDILGFEDHVGDMDFKVAGTSSGITALQMDIKIIGITSEILAEALDQAKAARLHILEKIQAVMPAPRPDLKPHAPRMTVIKVDPEKIGLIIGPGGKNIRGIQEEAGVRIDIEDDGTVFISAADGPSSERAREMIEKTVEEAVIGRIYTGKVVRTTDFGAFVEILPGTDGLVHISQLSSDHIEKVEDVARLGEEITVMVTDIDSAGKIRLSRQAVLEGWTAEEAMERDKKPSRSRSNSGSRSKGRGPRKRN
jgi:polyribonucleotide nucleotidyltransferase